MIEIKNVSKSYGTNKVLDNVSLTVAKSEIFGLVGYSGAGKSTLLRCINQLTDFDAGSIEVNGKNLSNLNTQEKRLYRSKIGLVFQHFNLLSQLTVYENIELAYRLSKIPVDKEEIVRMCSLVGLSDKMDAYPSNLSGGQKQRVGIARSLILKPDVLLCDEATSALDPKTTDEILDLIKSLQKSLDLTVIIVTHEIDVIKKMCQRVCLMEQGKVVAINNVREFFNSVDNTVQNFILSDHHNYEFEQVLLDYKHHEQKTILTLKFNESNSNTPIVSILSNKIDIHINIIYGKVDLLSYGKLIIEVDSNKLDQINQILNEYEIDYEVIKDE